MIALVVTQLFILRSYNGRHYNTLPAILLKTSWTEIDFFDKIKGEYDTLAGLVLELEGNIPKIGTVYKITPFTIVVESADLRKIKRLKVTIDEN